MASLREEARWILDEARDAICWIAVWKTGRSWNVETFYGVEYDEGRLYPPRESSWKIEEDDEKRLREIYEEDHDAIMVNGYYCNLGSLEEMTLESLINGIKFQYGLGGDIMRIIDMARARKEATA